jgi:hypothetical protein
MGEIADALVAVGPIVFATGMVDEGVTERIEIVPVDRIAALKASQIHTLSPMGAILDADGRG